MRITTGVFVFLIFIIVYLILIFLGRRLNRKNHSFKDANANIKFNKKTGGYYYVTDYNIKNKIDDKQT
jgi:hypothetical protein